MDGDVTYIHGKVKHKRREFVEIDLDRDDMVTLEKLIMELSNQFELNHKNILNREYYRFPIIQEGLRPTKRVIGCYRRLIGRF